MQIYHRLTALPAAAFGRGSAVALGFFDGVHIGHRAVISAAVDCARAEGLEAAVFTFSLPFMAWPAHHRRGKAPPCR